MRFVWRLERTTWHFEELFLFVRVFGGCIFSSYCKTVRLSTSHTLHYLSVCNEICRGSDKLSCYQRAPNAGKPGKRRLFFCCSILLDLSGIWNRKDKKNMKSDGRSEDLTVNWSGHLWHSYWTTSQAFGRTFLLSQVISACSNCFGTQFCSAKKCKRLGVPSDRMNHGFSYAMVAFSPSVHLMKTSWCLAVEGMAR